MESIKTALFESPTYIYLALVLAMLAMGAVWYERRSRTSAVCLAAAFLLIAAVFAIETLVVTDREQIAAALYEMATRVQGPGRPAERLEAVERTLDDTVIVDMSELFGQVDMGKEQALDAGRAVLAADTLKSVQVVRLTITVDGRRARSDFTTIVRYDTRDLGVQPGAIAWRAGWVKRKAGWRIIRVYQYTDSRR